MLSDRWSLEEFKYSERALNELKSVPWADPLLKRVYDMGGLCPENKDIMFEVRFAYELHLSGRIADYEYRTGVGDPSIDFRVHGSVEWLIEIVSIRASDAVKRATHKIGPVYVQRLSTNASDPAQSEEAEMVRVEEKISEKASKFPLPDSAIHLILVDMRGYLDKGRYRNLRSDIFDYRQIAYGSYGIPPDKAPVIHFWEMSRGRREPIKGLFEQSNPLKAAPLVQKRIHFLGFVHERDYREGEIRDVGCYLANWHQFSDKVEAQNAFASHPLSSSAEIQGSEYRR